MLLYTTSVTNRLLYITEVLFDAIGLVKPEITADKQQYLNYTGSKINYSSSRINDSEFLIIPVSLLFDKDIKPQSIEVFLFKETSAFYRSPGSDFPFDLFAASFYLLSRYEEYLPHSLDMYGRFGHENSLAFRNGFLHIPLINIWLKDFTNVLLQKFTGTKFQPSTFSFLPTYDIDIAWSFLNKGFVRNAGGFVRSFLKAEWTELRERIEVLQHKKRDPFDSYDWLDELHSKANVQPIYFYLLSEKNKGYDKNILPSNSNYGRLIKRLSNKYKTGIHPSWQTGDKQDLLREEIGTLEEICSKPISKSRQHYIRMKLPNTYRNLIDAGIAEDYSMGYGSINGFRASYCLPFKWYDLEKEEMTSLTIYPFCYMDANSYYEQHYTAQQALEEMEYYYDVTKNVNGLFITIWHNHFLGTDKMFSGWKEVYEEFLRKHF